MKNVITSIRQLARQLTTMIQQTFDQDNKVRFKHPVDGEVREYQVLKWFFLKFVKQSYYHKNGWIPVDVDGKKLQKPDNTRKSLPSDTEK